MNKENTKKDGQPSKARRSRRNLLTMPPQAKKKRTCDDDELCPLQEIECPNKLMKKFKASEGKKATLNEDPVKNGVYPSDVDDESTSGSVQFVDEVKVNEMIRSSELNFQNMLQETELKLISQIDQMRADTKLQIDQMRADTKLQLDQLIKVFASQPAVPQTARPERDPNRRTELYPGCSLTITAARKRHVKFTNTTPSALTLQLVTAVFPFEQLYRRNIKGGNPKPGGKNVGALEEKREEAIKKYPFNKELLTNLQDAVHHYFPQIDEKLIIKEVNKSLGTKLNQIHNHVLDLIAGKVEGACLLKANDDVGFENYEKYSKDVSLIKELDVKLEITNGDLIVNGGGVIQDGAAADNAGTDESANEVSSQNLSEATPSTEDCNGAERASDEDIK